MARELKGSDLAEIGCANGGIGRYVLAFACAGHPAAIDDDNLIGKIESHRHILFDHQKAEAVACELFQRGDQNIHHHGGEAER